MSNDMVQVQCLYYDNQKSENDIAADFLHKSVCCIMGKSILIQMIVSQMLTAHIRKIWEITHQDGNGHKTKGTGTLLMSASKQKIPASEFISEIQ